MRILTLILVITAALACVSPSLHAESRSLPIRIIVFPFEIHADADKAYLSEAAQEMLASRLFQRGRIEIVQEPVIPSDVNDAAERLREKSADYSILGSLTLFDQEVSIDATVLEAGNTAPVMVYDEYGRIADGVLIHIEKLAERIHQDLLEKQPSIPAAKIDVQAPASTWSSRRLNFNIVGLGVGDVTGDGRNELVTADEQKIRVLAFNSGKLVMLHEVPQNKNMKIIGVDVADINANQKAEVYLTMIRKNGGLRSAVLEWNGKTLSDIESDSEWFFRVHPLLGGETPVLVGQKAGSFWTVAPGVGEKGLFAAGVYRLEWQGQRLMPGNRVDLPNDADVYSFASGDIMGTGQSQTLAYLRKDRLRLLTDTEGEVWRSTEPYGGSMVYLETKPEVGTEENVRHYLSQRILLSDKDREGKALVVVVQNEDSGKRLFSRFRKFSGGWIKILSWNGTALQTAWQTDRLSGYISDLAVNDLNNDGRKDIICTLVTGAGSFSRKQTSRIMMFPMTALEP